MKTPEIQKVVKSSEMKATKQESLYGAFVQIRNTELSVYWTRYNIQSAINLGLFALVFSAKPGAFIQQYLIYVSLIGAILSVTWLLLTITGKQIINNRWEKHLRRYEETILDQRHRLFQNLKDEDDSKGFIKRNWQNLNILTRILPILCLLAWFFIFVINVKCK